MAIVPNFKTTTNYFERTATLVKYYRDVNEYSVVDADREKELFTLLTEGKKKMQKAKENRDFDLEKKYKKEVNSLRDFIIKSNLRFVLSIARIYGHNNNTLDIINEGNIGLIEAVDTFDVTMGNRFQTHAVYHIRQRINLYRQNEDLIIRKNNESKTYHIISNMTNKFIQEFQREPTSEELKEYINKHYPNAKIKDSADVLNVRVSSIDEPMDGDDDRNGSNAGNISMFNSYSASLNDYDGKCEVEHVSALINTLMRDLSPRDKSIIKMYFGIGEKYNSPCTISEIAARTKLSKERIRQIVVDTQKYMREQYKKNIDSILNR